MNKELKDKWVAALRSGKYSQTTGRLRSEEGFCCLGVLCDVEGADWEIQDGSFINTKYKEVAILDYTHRVKLGVENHTATLMDMNDEQGASFNEIADYIEQSISL